MWKAFLGKKINALIMDIQQVVKEFFRNIGNGNGSANACIIDQEIKSFHTPMLLQRGKQFGYEMIDVTTGEAVARAMSVVVWYDYGSNQSIVLPDEKKTLFSKPVAGTSSE